MTDGHWIGDEAIRLLLNVFALDGVRVIEIKTPESWDGWSQSHRFRLKDSQKAVLVPLHQPLRKHWVLLHINVVDCRATLYDSLPPQPWAATFSESAARAITSSIGFDCDAEGWKFITAANVPRQTNGDDCGVHVLVTCVFLIAELDLPKRVNATIWRAIFRCCNHKHGVAIETTALLQNVQQVLNSSMQAAPSQIIHARQQLIYLSAELREARATVGHVALLCESSTTRTESDNRFAREAVEVMQGLLDHFSTVASAQPFSKSPQASAALQSGLRDAQSKLDGTERRQMRSKAQQGTLKLLWEQIAHVAQVIKARQDKFEDERDKVLAELIMPLEA
ncbi:hypothetical protein SLS56_001194 [Neofusicoccum ribis]|uniref:Ubiquitin-like protease family profile domain-containing protein n=1 Tax=Neofusicoccum ribis TaxID=45134 RepID=A0ABR3T9L2_9PEZI